MEEVADEKKSWNINVVGPLHSNDGYLKLDPTRRSPFGEIFDGVTQRYKCYVVHGAWHSGKTTLLNALEEQLDLNNIKPIRLEGKIAKSKVDATGGAALYDYISNETFREQLGEDGLRNRLFEKYRPKLNTSKERICYLVDEMQAIQDLRETGVFFDWLADNQVPFVGVGTFELKELEWRSETEDKAPSPFNKAVFRKMPPFTGREMHELFDIFEKRFDENIPQEVKGEIIRESGGHAASFNVILLLQLILKPKSVGKFSHLLERRYKVFMNGMKYKVEDELRDRPDLRDLVRSLSGKFTDTWTVNLRTLSESWKRLFNVGILSVVGLNQAVGDDKEASKDDLDEVRFTSNIIYRVCIDNVFPPCVRLKTIKSPIHLLQEGIRSMSPRQLSVRNAWNRDGPSEDVFHSEIYATLRNVIPELWTCTNQARAKQGSNGKRMDLLIRDKDGNHYIGFEFKVESVADTDVEKHFQQADDYLSMLQVDVYLVNFASKNKNPPLPAPRCGTKYPELKVFFVNVLYDDACTEYDVCEHGKPKETIQTAESLPGHGRKS